MASEARFIDVSLADSLLGAGTDVGQVTDLALTRDHRAVIVFVGMAFEARIAEGPGIVVFSRDSRRELEATAASAARQGCRGIISFGVAGGLDDALRPGDWVVASSVVHPQGVFATDQGWSRNLMNAIGGARYAPVLGVEAPVAEPAKKRELHRATGAAAVDMESHVVARLAAAHGLAFTALRVIVDPAHRVIPNAALMGMGAGPRADSIAVLRDVIARPAQASLLIRIMLDALIARSEMQRVRRLLGPHFGLAELSQPELGPSELAESDLAASAVASYRSPA
jgi:adenosylhomocysteine nucleosidase